MNSKFSFDPRRQSQPQSQDNNNSQNPQTLPKPPFSNKKNPFDNIQDPKILRNNSHHQHHKTDGEENFAQSSPQKKKFPCHLYQSGDCKKGDSCLYFHPEKPVGACIEPKCPLCDMRNEFKYCNGENCYKFCKKKHLKVSKIDEKISLVLEALRAQVNIINKCKYELQDLLNAESETKQAVVTKLKQLLEQRRDFINVVNKKILKFYEKPGDEHHLLSIEIEVKLFSRGLPAYSVCKRVKKELSKDGERFFSILGETGSGKTTQVPQFLYQEIKHQTKKILCIQPRKIAAMSLAARVAEELGVRLGEEVGFQVGSAKKPREGEIDGQYTESKFTNNTKILFMTESVLLKRLIVVCKAPAEKRWKFFGNVQAILLDEVHERSLLSDLIFGILKSSFVSIFPKIKIFLASATVNVGLFSEYFDNCPTIEIPGRTFPVQIKYKPMFEDNYLQGTVEVIKEVINQKRRGNTDYQGHVLVFLTGVEEMEEVHNRIKHREGNLEEEYMVCFLHGSLGNKEQQKIFDTKDTRNKIILATKIAESSITINGVRIVIDSGYDKDSYYDSQKGINVLELDWISQASAKQRMGRAGRTAPGICFRLYSEDTFQRFELHKKPEIAKINLEAALLKIIDFGLDPRDFPFLEHPGAEVIESTVKNLRFLGALDGQTKLTAMGKLMMEMSTEPKKTKAIIMAAQLGCLNEMLQVISMESYERSIYFLPKDKKERAEAVGRRIQNEGYRSDHLDYLQTFRCWKRMSPQDRKVWCQQKSIKAQIMKEVERMSNDLRIEVSIIRKKNSEVESLLLEAGKKTENPEENILKCLLGSSIISLAKYSGSRYIGYVNVLNGALFHIHISSRQSDYFPQISDIEKEFAVYSKMDNLNGLNKAKIVSFIKSDWLQDRSLISKEMLEKIQAGIKENYKFDSTTIQLPSWSVKLFKKLFKDRINQWIESKKGNNSRQTIQMTQSNDSTIHFIHSNDLSKQVRDLYEVLKRELDENILSDNLIYNMENTNYTPIITEGLRVSEILFAGEFITLSYQVNGKRNKDQMLSLFGQTEKDIHYITVNESQKNTEGDVRFYNKKEAAKFYESFQKKEEHKLKPVFPYNKKVNMFDSCKIKVTFCLAKPLCVAKITFENPFDAEFVMEKLKKTPSIDGMTVKVQTDKKNHNAFYINNLSPHTDEYILKNFVAGKFSLPKISVHREANDSGNMLLEMEAKARFISLFTSDLSPEEIQNMYFTFKHSKKFKNMTHALITMPSKAIALKIMQKYDGQIGVFGTQRLRVKIKNSITLKINQNIFRVMALVILNKIEEIKKSQSGVNIRINNPKKTNHDVSCFYKVKITSNDNNINRVVAAKIEALTRGENFPISSQDEKMALFGSVMMDYYPKIQQEINKARPNSCFINAEPRSKKLRLYSPFEGVREEAREMIQKALKKLVRIEFIDLKSYNIKKVKAFIDNSNKNFPSLQFNDSHKFDVNLDYRAKRVFIKADKNFIEGFKKGIEQFLVAEKNKSEESCPICFEDLTGDCCMLYKCGHKFCKEDLKTYLESQEFKPHLECPLSECDKILTFGDIKNVLSVDSMNSIIEDNVKIFVATQHKIYRNCPTPDCCHIFKVGQKEYRCEGCFENYCILNLDDIHQAHPDVNCTQFKSSNQTDKQFQELIAKGEVKIAKCCHVPLIKEAGCNRITCTQCGKHFCWICLEVFDSQNDTYGHLTKKHGGYN